MCGIISVAIMCRSVRRMNMVMCVRVSSYCVCPSECDLQLVLCHSYYYVLISLFVSFYVSYDCVCACSYFY